MAEMATAAEAETAWQRLRRVNPQTRWTPIVYVNSTAEVKAFCGRNGGSACTSGNCARVLKHYLDLGHKIFFLPDEHLATNTAHDLGLLEPTGLSCGGVSGERGGLVAKHSRAIPDGGLTDEQIANARIVVWDGYCHVHTNFTLEHVRAARDLHPEAKIIIHPEAPCDVVHACDAHGSTAEIIRFVANAPANSTIIIGTEHQLVSRLAEEYNGEHRIFALFPSSCPNMARTTKEAVQEIVQNWPVANRVSVPADIAADARLCLERMLAL